MGEYAELSNFCCENNEEKLGIKEFSGTICPEKCYNYEVLNGMDYCLEFHRGLSMSQNHETHYRCPECMKKG